jgi:hypothetical protein
MPHQDITGTCPLSFLFNQTVGTSVTELSSTSV